ncbi:hypothetical protein [Halobellus sp. EA9]|uniref:hypothetical protein n=1 Tax=Halobellus sp. EA9 TaxID=3421647 RepID=UPI003EC098F4
MQRSFQYIGLSLVILGAMLTIVPTGSFSTIAGDRPVDVAVAGDSEAFIAIIDTNNEVTQPGSATTVAELENNLESSMTVEYEASVDTDALAVQNPSETTTIRQGGRTPLEVTCSPPNGGSGTATLTVEIVEATGQSATIKDATLEVPVEYDCPGRTAGNRPPEPGQPPGDAVAYVDDDHDYAYDEGERIVPRDEIPSFQNDSAHLVIAAGGETLDYTGKVQIKAKSVTVGEATLATNKKLKIEAEGGAISLRDSTVDSQNEKLKLKASEVTTSGTTITAKKKVKLTAESGGLTLTDATVESNNGKIKLKGYPVDATGATITTTKKIKMESESGTLAVADATVDSENGKIKLKGPSVDASGATITAAKKIKMKSESGTLTLADATVESKNGKIKLKGYPVDATGATITTTKKIKMESESGTLAVADATVDSKNGKVKLKGPSVDASGATITAAKKTKLTAESGELTVTDATVESKNGKIKLKSNAKLRASSAVIETSKKIKLTSSGDMTLDGAEISSTNGQATLTLNQASATLAIDKAVLQDRDSTVVYSPSGVTVTGTPAQGSVQAG